MDTKQIQKMTDAEYFSMPAISASQLKAFDKGAYWFWKSSPFNPDRVQEQDSDAMMFGKLAHCMLLEPEKVDDEFEIADFGKSRSNKKYLELKETTSKVLVTSDEYSHAQKMIAEIRDHKLASAIIDGATAEMPYFWIDEATKLYCKCKIDAIKRTRNGIVVIDYKTSSSIPELLRYAQKSQYAIQAEFYKEAVRKKYGEDPAEFVFIIQSNKEGEEDIICVADVELETQEAAKTIMQSHMELIKSKLELWNATHDKNIWSAYPEREFIRYSNYYLTTGEK